MTKVTALSFTTLDLNCEPDVDFVISQHLEIQKIWNPKYILNQEDKIRETQKLITHQNESLNLVVVHNKKIIAFHRVQKKQQDQINFGQILSSWVAPNFRRNGLIYELKAKAYEWAKCENLKYLQTRVHRDNNRIISLNLRLGYQVVCSDEFIILKKFL